MLESAALRWFYSVFGQLVAIGGGGAAIAYMMFRWFGQRWIEQRFQQQLEKFKHEQQKELEELRHRIKAIFSRISKIHEKEFEILPRAWELLHEAHGAVFQLVKPFRQWPDLDQMPEPQLAEFLGASRLAEFQKTEIRQQKEKVKYYQDTMYWYELSDAKKAQIALNNYLAVNSIFMTEQLQRLLMPQVAQIVSLQRNRNPPKWIIFLKPSTA